MTTGEKIKRCRALAGKSQAELASELGITPQALGNWERDERHPRPQTLGKIAAALGVSVDELASDGTLAGMGIFTGLTEPAIDKLNTIAKENPEYSDFLSAMIADCEFEMLVEMTYMYTRFRDFTEPLAESPARPVGEVIQAQLDRILSRIK